MCANTLLIKCVRQCFNKSDVTDECLYCLQKPINDVRIVKIKK